MAIRHDVRIRSCRLYFLPVVNRVPLKFGHETVTGVTCARAMVEVEGRTGGRAVGWGETPLNASWVWPSELSYAERDAALRKFCRALARALPFSEERGHAMEVGHLFIEHGLPRLWHDFNAGRDGAEPLPWLAALTDYSAFDIALHDAYATLHGKFVYETYGREFMNRDLAWYFGDGDEGKFDGVFPGDFFTPMAKTLPAWHLVGGRDALVADDLRGDEPDDDYPVTLEDWIRRDKLTCLKVKLSGNDADADYRRLSRVGEIGEAGGAGWLCADFNCTVEKPSYVVDILDRLETERPGLYERILYLEQPFPYDLRRHMTDVRSVSEKKPLLMDESAHDWKHVRLGKELGWTGAALKTCKTQTGALLSLCWAKAHGMPVMVQDLTNPMLAQIPHVLLAAHAGTLRGVETNAMQFYPEASAAERRVHPGLYVRRDGCVNLASVGTTGFGYRLDEIGRMLPQAEDVSN